MTEGLRGLVDEYLDWIDRHDVPADVITSRLLAAGWSSGQILDEVVPAALRRVGELWEASQWTVAQEHIATERSEQVVSILSPGLDGSAPLQQAGAGAAPGASETGDGRLVIVACAEGEWHTFPARVVAACLHRTGWDVITLGPSVAASQLIARIHDHGPDLVVVSCSMTSNLVGASKMLITAREADTPTIAGGAAFGAGDTRARRLGATAWAASGEEAVTLAGAVAGFSAGTSSVPATNGESALIQANVGQIVRRLSSRLRQTDPGDRQASAGMWMLRALSAALLCDEVEIFTEYLGWHERRLKVGAGAPASQVLEAIVQSLPPEAAKARAWVIRALEAESDR